MCKTERDVKEAWLPGEVGYATKVPTDLLILTIVICYSVIAPLIIPFGAIYFGLGWLIFRNQVRPLLSIMILISCFCPIPPTQLYVYGKEQENDQIICHFTCHYGTWSSGV